MMTDLFTTAMAWIQDKGLPEPDSLRLAHGDRIELNYYTADATALPMLEWSHMGMGHVKSEHDCGGVLVSVVARTGAAA